MIPGLSKIPCKAGVAEIKDTSLRVDGTDRARETDPERATTPRKLTDGGLVERVVVGAEGIGRKKR